jgi:AraC-like DNA-binding protein
MGNSYHNYLNEIRLASIYQELVNTQDSIKEIAERNGMLNQKLFNQSFKQLYGCRPSEVRKSSS